MKDGGHFGFIVSSAWLDVEYGKGLQEFFLQNYKIITILESKVERWFSDADINTCIIILEKCPDEKERMNNLTWFVLLKKPLRQFIPAAEYEWNKQIERNNSIEKLIQTILSHSKYYENNDLRIYPIPQQDLWNEGYNKTEQNFTGAKWGKYLRAPKIFFTILEKGKDKLIPLKEVAKVRFGIKTGVNEFFYLTEEKIKRLKIEEEFLQPVIFTLKEINGYSVQKDKLKYHVLICNKQKDKLKGKNILKYINWGEKNNLHKRPTCASRQPWYSLGEGWPYAPLIFPAKVGERMPVILNKGIFEDKKLYGIIPNNKENIQLLGAILNSTYTRMMIEFTCRQLIR